MGNVHIYPGALERLEKSAGIKSAVRETCERLAANVEAQGITVGGEDGSAGEYPLPVRIGPFGHDPVNDRPGVVLAHPAGKAVQAKHGVLTRAASESGLRVQ